MSEKRDATVYHMVVPNKLNPIVVVVLIIMDSIGNADGRRLDDIHGLRFINDHYWKLGVALSN